MMKHLRMICCGVVMASAVAQGAIVSYLAPNADGTDWETITTNNVTVVTANMNTLTSGVYVVQGVITNTNRMIVSGDVHLILSNGCALNATKGITVKVDNFVNLNPNGKINNAVTNSLTIYAQSTRLNMGQLTATGGEGYAGIGGGLHGTGGAITINGGKIIATGMGATRIDDSAGMGTVIVGGKGGAGIGGGEGGAGGTITIHGGNVTAIGNEGGAGIGGGENGASGTIMITGGSVTAKADFGADIGEGGGSVVVIGNRKNTFHTGELGHAFILALSSLDNSTSDKSSWHGVIFEGSTGAVYGPSITLMSDATIPEGATLTIANAHILTIAAGVALTNYGTIDNKGTLDNKGIIFNFDTILDENNKIIGLDPLQHQSISYLSRNNVGETTQATNVCFVITSDSSTWLTGWYVVTGAVSITNRVTVSGDVHLILADGAKLNAAQGITVQDDDNDRTNGSANGLTIYAQSMGQNMGQLTATGSFLNAGIGGNNLGTGGTITINGGSVSITGGVAGGAGIGGGENGASGTITINGGTVTATGSAGGAGIGGGVWGVGGTITINGGTVTATGSAGGAGIGGGDYSGDGGTFSTGNNGNAFIVTSSISNQSGKVDRWRGVIFEGDNGSVYGTSMTLTTDAEIPAGHTLTLTPCQRVTVAPGVTLTNNGTITISDCACELCRARTHVIIPAYVTQIAAGAFTNCTELVAIRFMSLTPPTIGADVFATGKSPKVYVPSDADKAAYEDAGMNVVSISEATATIDTLDLAALGATSGPVTLRLAPSVFSVVSDNLRVLHWTTLDGDPQTLAPSRYMEHADGRITVEVNVPTDTPQGFFSVQFGE